MHDPVAEEREDVALREDDALVVEGAVLEAEHHAALHHITAARDLDQLALGELLAAQRAENREAAGNALDVLDGDRIGIGEAGSEEGEEHHYGSERRPDHGAAPLKTLQRWIAAGASAVPGDRTDGTPRAAAGTSRADSAEVTWDWTREPKMVVDGPRAGRTPR